MLVVILSTILNASIVIVALGIAPFFTWAQPMFGSSPHVDKAVACAVRPMTKADTNKMDLILICSENGLHILEPERFVEHADEAKLILYGKGFRPRQACVGATH
jgi:hypothetical protein